jgi:aryl-alcohol dehydrogenase-like predicted oxidoreductase
VIPIPGTKHAERLNENLGALEVRLTAQDVARISAAIPPGTAAGARYPEQQMTHVYV